MSADGITLPTAQAQTIGHSWLKQLCRSGGYPIVSICDGISYGRVRSFFFGLMFCGDSMIS